MNENIKEMNQSEDSIYLKQKYDMFQEEFEKLAKKETQKDQKVETKYPKKPKKPSRRKIHSKTAHSYFDKFKMEEPVKATLPVDPMSIFKWKKTAQKREEIDNSFLDQPYCK